MLLPKRILMLVSLLAALSSCASSPSGANRSAACGYHLQIDGDVVSLSFARDLTVPEFLQLAQEVTSARYVYRHDQVANSGPVTLLGRVQCQRSEFPSFVGTMLYIRGLQAEVRGSGDTQYVEVEPIAKG